MSSVAGPHFEPGLVAAISKLADEGAAGPRRLGLLLGADDPADATVVHHLLALEVTLRDDLRDVCDAVEAVAGRLERSNAPARIVGWVVAGFGHGTHADDPLAALNAALFGTGRSTLIVADADSRRASVYLVAGRAAHLLGSGALTPAQPASPHVPRRALSAAVALLVGCGVVAGIVAHAAGLAA